MLRKEKIKIKKIIFSPTMSETEADERLFRAFDIILGEEIKKEIKGENINDK